MLNSDGIATLRLSPVYPRIFDSNFRKDATKFSRTSLMVSQIHWEVCESEGSLKTSPEEGYQVVLETGAGRDILGTIIIQFVYYVRFRSDSGQPRFQCRVYTAERRFQLGAGGSNPEQGWSRDRLCQPPAEQCPSVGDPKVQALSWRIPLHCYHWSCRIWVG